MKPIYDLSLVKIEPGTTKTTTEKSCEECHMIDSSKYKTLSDIADVNPNSLLFMTNQELLLENVSLKERISKMETMELKFKQAEDTLKKSEQELLSIIHWSPIPAFVIGKDHQVIHWNKALEEMSRIKSEEILGTRKQWQAFYTEERPCLVDLLVDEAFDAVSQWYYGKYIQPPLLEGVYDVTDYFPALGKDGKWLRLTAAPIRDSKGMIVAALETMEDISDRKQAEMALHDSELKYRTLVELTHDMIFMVDMKGLFTYMNPNFEKAVGYEFPYLKGHPFTYIIAPERRDAIIGKFKEGARGAPSIPYETEILNKDGRRIAVEFLASNFFDLKGNVIGRFGVGRDITKRKEMEARLRESEKRYRELSIIDELTQLYNSRYFYHRLEIETFRINRYGGQLALILLDLDDFKTFNDTYGHVEGDQVLIRLGRVIKKFLRMTDSAYRYGGEEFTILMPMTTNKNAAIIAETIRTEFNKEIFSPVPGKEVHMTMSVGVGQYKPHGDMKDFVNLVDKYMYKAKKNGKDKVCSELS
ncbi:MAG: hypothetical protein CSYNP_00445 [Syntrophus sp. SKADARSKE-3]|nr:hypothetical protein [Syntrophus sp. SKADARSKE-3]